jgi:hypothetical protein
MDTQHQNGKSNTSNELLGRKEKRSHRRPHIIYRHGHRSWLEQGNGTAAFFITILACAAIPLIYAWLTGGAEFQFIPASVFLILYFGFALLAIFAIPLGLFLFIAGLIGFDSRIGGLGLLLVVAGVGTPIGCRYAGTQVSDWLKELSIQRKWKKARAKKEG